MGLVAVDLRRERSREVVVRFRDALVYIDGEHASDQRVDAIRSGSGPGFLMTADRRDTNRASVTFDEDHRIALHRVSQ
ncbi:hypothetical protein [Paraburkholderia fynbosensis]|uniref:Uncharacterized protein n=1 Tax=Paraburkholderia fynbosensis TaxID=1200993 RepID=A0A6J5GWF4_9BURK|nr:hypothetical protein [Paraburkholderia fynbosensis]CAB3808197.1 hypothetical protein LMG27177_06494 [Paraburkholderia fynbosensis]